MTSHPTNIVPIATHGRTIMKTLDVSIYGGLLCALCAATLSSALAAVGDAASSETASSETVLYVSPHGNDEWTGALAEANPGHTDGPFATVQAAQRAVRELLKTKQRQSIRVKIRGGWYETDKPLLFTEEDMGSPERRTSKRIDDSACPVIYEAYEGEVPLFSGGRRIKGWRVEDLNGREVWVAHLPEVESGQWSFRQLWVNGARRYRPRLPKTGEYQVTAATGQRDRFEFKQGELDPTWKSLQDVELRFHAIWLSIHTRIQSVDPENRLVVMDRPSHLRLVDRGGVGAAYTVTNVFEALEEPGQWYLDRPTGKLYYLPACDESIEETEIVAPVATELLRIEHSQDIRPDGRKAAVPPLLIFKGITFSYNHWQAPPDFSASVQAAIRVPAALTLSNARYCAFYNCAFTHLGTYAVDLCKGSWENAVCSSRMVDLGGGGIKISDACNRNTVADCEIGDGGILYPDAVGILVGQSSGNRIIHNHIHDLYYSGISVGWTWGYAAGNAFGNIIEYNHIHDIGKGKLSDMGGIYTLGVATGTRLRHNVIYDVNARRYGGWGIYTDEGSSDILIENNIVYRASTSPIHQHFGRDNLIVNNIFAFGELAQIEREIPEDHNSFTVTRNIFYGDNGLLISGAHGHVVDDWGPQNADFHRNLYWDTSTGKPSFSGLDFQQWQQRGMDNGSVVADPLFIDPVYGDFRVSLKAPVDKIGFRPIDTSEVGPRMPVGPPTP